MNAGGGVGGYIASRDEERYIREYNGFLISITGTAVARPVRLRPVPRRTRPPTACARPGKDWTGNSVYLWAIANAVYMALLGPAGLPRGRRAILQRAAYAAQLLGEIQGVQHPVRARFLQGIRRRLHRDRPDRGRDQPGACARRHLRRQGPVRRVPRLGPVRPLLRDRDPQPGRHRPARRRRRGGRVDEHDRVRRVPRGRLGRAAGDADGRARAGAGMFFPPVEPEIAAAWARPTRWSPRPMRRRDPPRCRSSSEPEVQRHYLRLSQQTLGMMNVSLFGTCTMKYHARVAEDAGAAPSGRGPPAPARGHAAGHARGRPRLRPDPARAVGHGPVHLPARRRCRCRLYPCRASPAPSCWRGASSSSATRSSPRSRPIPATPPPPPRPGSRS